MGAWSFGPFDNDDASDWLAEVADEDAESRVKMLRDALETEREEELDTRAGAEAVAAAALIAAQLPGSPVALPASAPKLALPSHELRELQALAKRALVRVLGDDSELTELWRDTGERDWEDSVREILQALQADY